MSGLPVDLTISPPGPGVLGVEGPGTGDGVTAAGVTGACVPVFLPLLLTKGSVAGDLMAAIGVAARGFGDSFKAGLDSLAKGLVPSGPPLAAAGVLLLAWAVKYPLFIDRGTKVGSGSGSSFLISVKFVFSGLMVITPLTSALDVLGPTATA